MAISLAQLTIMQGLVNARLPNTCTITRRSSVSDGIGGQTVTWATVATVACLVEPISRVQPKDVDVAERITDITRWDVTLPVGTDVQADDRLVINGTTYTVLEPAPILSYPVELRVITSIVVS